MVALEFAGAGHHGNNDGEEPQRGGDSGDQVVRRDRSVLGVGGVHDDERDESGTERGEDEHQPR